MYQAGSWKYPRRLVLKIEKSYGQLTHMYTFIATNMEMKTCLSIQFYCGHGKMKHFIKEGKMDLSLLLSQLFQHSQCQSDENSHACVQLIQLVQADILHSNCASTVLIKRNSTVH